MKLDRIKKIKELDIRGLAYCMHGMEIVREDMRAATIRFLIDKYSEHKASKKP